MSPLELVCTAIGWIIALGIAGLILTVAIGLTCQALYGLYDFYRSIFRGICSIFKKPKRRRRQTP